MKGQKGFVTVAAFPRRQGGLVWLQTLVRRILRWNELARQRRRLAGLNEAALKDLGLSRADVFQETERHFWNDPLVRK
ncbi:MAG TPA: DUF1127 domain-containing protein [Pseudomonas sp.]|nr:DUF1127 domain-containing protein [Pseudomonas sp.]